MPVSVTGVNKRRGLGHFAGLDFQLPCSHLVSTTHPPPCGRQDSTPGFSLVVQSDTNPGAAAKGLCKWSEVLAGRP